MIHKCSSERQTRCCPARRGTTADRSVTKRLLAHDATVYIAGRSPAKATAAIEQLESELPHIYGRGRVRFLKVDMSNMHDVQGAGESFMARVSRLDVLGLSLYLGIGGAH